MKWRYFGTGNIADICIYVFPMILMTELDPTMPSWSACQQTKVTHILKQETLEQTESNVYLHCLTGKVLLIKS